MQWIRRRTIRRISGGGGSKTAESSPIFGSIFCWTDVMEKKQRFIRDLYMAVVVTRKQLIEGFGGEEIKNSFFQRSIST